MERSVNDALGRGCRFMYGGTRGNGRGYFWHPTFITDVPDDALLMTESPSVPLRQFPASRPLMRLLLERTACPPAWPAMVSPLHSKSRPTSPAVLRRAGLGSTILHQHWRKCLSAA